MVSESQLALVEEAGDDSDAPRYRLRVDGGPEPPEVTALTEGLTFDFDSMSSRLRRRR